MKIEIVQTTVTRLTENRDIISRVTAETYVLTPSIGKKLQHIKTGAIYKCSLSLGTNEKPEDYREID